LKLARCDRWFAGAAIADAEDRAIFLREFARIPGPAAGTH
jgi:hypothetical protein